jgi:uncharacterized lipoprotein NlpE involved in copper resistance
LTKYPSSKSAIAVYGCHNKTREVPDYLAQDGYFPAGANPDGTFVRSARYVAVPHVMSTNCRYDRAATDPRCVACKNLPAV